MCGLVQWLGFGLDVRGIVRFLTRAGVLYLLQSVETSTGIYSASQAVFPRVDRRRPEAKGLVPSSTEVKSESNFSLPSLPHVPSDCAQG